MSYSRIRKAVFPVAGLGTRFLPATKSIPKEMLTVVDRPIIQHVVDEAREAGIEHFVFVTGRNKTAIEDHFDKQFELEETLRARGKTEELKQLQAGLLSPGQVSYTRQQEPLGLGHAVWCARDIVGNEPFALILPDMIMRSEKGCLAQMLERYNSHGGNVIAVEEVAATETHKYGVVGLEKDAQDNLRIKEMVEKPPQGTAPSNSIISGRYILQPEIFTILETATKGISSEIQLTDAMAKMLDAAPFYAVPFDGQVFDCGSKLGYLSANLAFGLSDNDVGKDFLDIAKKYVMMEKNK